MATPPRARRSDAQRNRDRLLEVARTVFEEQGAQASLRDIARRAEVGLGTLYRHFPTRDALLDSLLGRHFDALAAQAADLAAAHPPREALTTWLRAFAAQAAAYQDLSAALMDTINDETSPLHASCSAMRGAGARLLRDAQDAGDVRPDVDGLELFALVNAVAWITGHSPAVAARRDHLLDLVLDGLAAPSSRR
ncbi:helix-turn-helix domain-containing protein [Actinocorallia libanotica]|uniref:TetR/AcrR family transcriptional regulator n=1 Tax=Actinocorallia libanotica TaxID=46162 RepID=A0ABN1RHE0_9ACTN